MPEYLSVETYIRCPDERLSSVLGQFRYLLEHLGYTNPIGASKLTQIVWESDGGGFGVSLDPEHRLRKVMVNDQPVFVRPIVDGWTQQRFPYLQEPWISCTLAFETQTSRQNFDTV